MTRYIQKKFQGIVPEGRVMDTYDTGRLNSYSCNYINNHSVLLNILSSANNAGAIQIGKIGIEWGRLEFVLNDNTYKSQSISFTNTYKYAPCVIACATVGTSVIQNVGSFEATTTSAAIFMTVSSTSTTSRSAAYIVIGELAD